MKNNVDSMSQEMKKFIMNPTSPVLTAFVLALALALLCPSAVQGAVVTITTDTSIGCSETTLDNEDVIVEGVTLTMDCAHPLASLVVRQDVGLNPGVVTHTAGSSLVGIYPPSSRNQAPPLSRTRRGGTGPSAGRGRFTVNPETP